MSKIIVISIGVFLVCLLTASRAQASSIVKKDGYWLLMGKEYSAKIDNKSGEIYEIINQQSNRDMFGGERGHLEISFPPMVGAASFPDKEEIGLEAGYSSSLWVELKMPSSVMERLARLVQCRHCSCRAAFTGLHPVFDGVEDIVKGEESTGAGIGLFWPFWAYGRDPGYDVYPDEIPTIILLPPYQLSGGYTYLELELPVIPKNAKLVYSGKLRNEKKADNSSITYKVQIWNGKEWQTIHTNEVSSTAWEPEQEIDLADYAGKQIQMRLVAETATRKYKGSITYGTRPRLEAYWGSPRIVWGENVLSLTQIVTRKILEPCRGEVFKGDWRVDSGRVDGNHLILKQRMPGADFEVESTYTALEDAVIWNVEVASLAGKDREVSVDFAIPVVKPDTQTFDCTGAGVRRQGEMSGILSYRGDGTYVPSFTILNQKEDDGLTMITPFEIKKPALDFLIDASQSSGSAIMRLRHLRLSAKGKGTTKAGIILTTHEGDWRPGLGWMRRHYAEYFEVPHPVIRKYEANVAMLNEWYLIPPIEQEENTRANLKNYADAGLNWMLGTMLPCSRETGIDYGNYIWEDISPEILKMTNHFIDLALEHQIGSFPYFQIFELDQHSVHAQGWEDWVVRDSMGNPMASTTWLYMLNPADLPGNPWRKHMLTMFEMFFKKLPNVAGIWMDRADFWFLDFSKDDGISMADGKPTSCLGIVKEDIFEQISNICDRYNKCMYIGTNDIETVRWADGQLVEGARRPGRLAQYHGLAKPLFRLRGWQVPEVLNVPAHTPEWVKAMDYVLGRETRWGLIIGAHMEIHPEIPAGKRLLPLVRLLDGREWVLDAHALELPEGVEGNIYRRPNGNVIVPVVLSESISLSTPPPDPKPRPVEVTVHFSGIEKVNTVEMITEQNHEYIPVPFIRKGDKIVIVVPEVKSAAMIVLR